jgi:fructose-1-phosphate kinase PfkB-like protein
MTDCQLRQEYYQRRRKIKVNTDTSGEQLRCSLYLTVSTIPTYTELDIWVASKDKRLRMMDNFIQDILRDGITHVQTPLVIEI